MKASTMQTLQLGIGAVSAAAVVAVAVATLRRRSEIELTDPTETIRRPKLRRLKVPVVAVAYDGTTAREPTRMELDAVVFTAMEGTYEAIRAIRKPRWQRERNDYDAGTLSIRDLWSKAAGHVSVALSFGGDFRHLSTGARATADLVAFWIDWISRNYPEPEHVQKVLDLAELQITRPTSKEQRWMMDYCKPLIYRLTEQAPLLHGSPVDLWEHPCDGNPAARPRFAGWTFTRLIGLKNHRQTADLATAMRFVLELDEQKRAIPQAGDPSEVTLDWGAVFEAFGTLIVQAMSLQVVAMVDTARAACSEQSANPDGC
ncbi:MAG: hypothetical protein A2V88_08340 [Elusimicrobia bacterium RBG_16_66_12]|nr:MAG: hypothetical protein A2V88_08340 [Elusimicrobia bacterium RBG_16_66_12]